MSIVYVKELFPSRRARDGVDKRTQYVRQFEMRTDDPEDAGEIAGTSPDIPRNGEAYPGDDTATLTDITVDQSSEDNTLWLITLTYTSEIPAEQAKEGLGYDTGGNPSENSGSSTAGSGQVTREPDPRNRPPKFSVTWEQTTEIIRKDINGRAVVNSAGDPFDPPPTIERSYPIITIQKNVSLDNEILSIDSQSNWQEIVNSDQPWQTDVKTLRFVRFDHSSEEENGIAYASVTLSIKVKWYGWLLQLVDAGFREKLPPTAGFPLGRMVPIRDSRGDGITSPALLDGSGRQLAIGSNPNILDFEVYRPMAFIPILALMGVNA
jgi:hypothetical protein